MVKIDASKFVIERDPKQEEPKPKYTSSLGKLGFLSNRREPKSLYDLIYWHPNTIAKLLEDSGVTVEALKQYIEQSDVRSFKGGAGLFEDPDEDQDDLFDDEDEDEDDEDESRAA